MAISFTLNLTPNQIEFLQTLALYADGIIPVADVADVSSGGHRGMFITWVHKLIREGLVQHVVPKAGEEKYEGGVGGNLRVIRAYRITDKGQQVLAIIEADVQAFIARQQDYAKKRKNKTA